MWTFTSIGRARVGKHAKPAFYGGITPVRATPFPGATTRGGHGGSRVPVPLSSFPSAKDPNPLYQQTLGVMGTESWRPVGNCRTYRRRLTEKRRVPYASQARIRTQCLPLSCSAPRLPVIQSHRRCSPRAIRSRSVCGEARPVLPLPLQSSRRCVPHGRSRDTCPNRSHPCHP